MIAMTLEQWMKFVRNRPNDQGLVGERAALAEIDRLNAQVEGMKAALAPFAKVGGYISDQYPDNHITSVQCDIRRDVHAAWQADYDAQVAEGKKPPYMRPSELNWPKECLALDTLNVGHFRAAKTFSSEDRNG